MSKGQSINIDWTLGLALFIVTLLSSISLFISSQPSFNDISTLESKALEIQSNLDEEIGVEGREVPLQISSPYQVENVPLDKSYSFPDNIFPGTATMNTFSEVDESRNRVVSIANLDNTTYRLNYFSGEMENQSYSGDLEIGNDISNSLISITPENPGLTSLEFEGDEFLNDEADLNSEDPSIEENNIYADIEMSNTDITFYDRTPELIIHTEEEMTFNLVDFSDLYWYEDENYDLKENPEGNEGETQGFTLTSDTKGITFLGDMSASVSRPDDSTTEAEISTEELRVRLHNTEQEGIERIHSHVDGETSFGVGKEVQGFSKTRAHQINNLTDPELEEVLNTGTYGYEIIFGPWLQQRFEKQEDWNKGSFTGTTADRNANSGNLGLGYRNGTAEDSRIGYWRLDAEVDGDGGTVTDYSGNNNDGETINGVQTGVNGILGASAYKFGGEDAYISADNPETIDHHGELSGSFWFKAEEKTNSEPDIIGGPRRNTDNGWGIYNDIDNNGQIRFEVNGDNNLRDDVRVEGLSLEEWYFTYFEFDSGDMRLKVVDSEGDIVDSSDGAFTDEGNIFESEVNIGRRGGDSSRLFRGKIDEFQLFNSALPQTDIENFYFQSSENNFEGEYRTGEIFESSQEWRELSIETDVPPETSLELEFEAVNTNNNLVDSEVIEVEDGKHNYSLSVEDSEGYRATFRGESTNPEESWEVRDFEVEYGPLINRGSTPPVQDVAVSDIAPIFTDHTGNHTEIQSTVRVW